jgi:small subunit ribosomal protein S1
MGGISFMTDHPETPAPEENFAELLEAFSPGSRSDARVGDRVKGRVISIGKDTVFVDTRMKIDAVVDRSELLDADQNLTCAEGDELELYVAAVGENEIRLSRAISGIGGIQILREAHQKSAPVEGKVKETCKGGFSIEIMQRRAFCPISQIDIAPVPEPGAHVGATYQFLITRLEDKGRNIVVSRRALLSRELEVARKQFLSTLNTGDVLDGRVTRIMPFGAFVELTPGVEGMVHVSEISWSKTATPEEILKPGDRLRVKVLGIDPAGSKGQARIGLSIKQLEEDPWLSVEEKFREGDVVRGKVTRCMNFGAFVEIAPGIEGMVHISELSYTRRVHKTEEIVNPGDAVNVVVKAVDPEKKRISLSLRDAEGDPWAEVLDRFSVGQRVDGVLEKKEKFGYFIRLAPGITGLLPIGSIRRSSGAAALEKAKEGDTLSVAIEEINLQRRRISLASSSSEDEGEWQRFTPNSRASSLGSLAEKLQSAITSQKRSG